MHTLHMCCAPQRAVAPCGGQTARTLHWPAAMLPLLLSLAVSASPTELDVPLAADVEPVKISVERFQLMRDRVELLRESPTVAEPSVMLALTASPCCGTCLRE